MSEQRVQKVKGSGVWEHFTVRDGLPDMKIECLFEDSRGMLWIGTHDRGVARFDGDRFEAFTTRDGLSGDAVFSILEDREGDLWFGTDGGLTHYDGKVLHPVHLGPDKCYDLLSWGRCEDRQGRLWFGLRERPGYPAAVYRWDGRRLELFPLTDVVKPKGQRINQVVSDDRGDLWFGGDGLYRYDGETCHRIAEPSDIPGRIWSLLPQKDGTLWIGTSNGLFVYRNGQFEKLEFENPGEEPAVRWRRAPWVVALLQDPSGAVWLTIHDGRVIRHEDGEFRMIRNLDAELWGKNLCVDRTDRLWVGTSGKGLYCYDTTRFQIFREEHGLPSNEVNSLAEDADGVVWVSTEAGTVGYDGGTFRPLEGAGEREGGHATVLLVDRGNHLWTGTWSGELYVYDGGELHPISEDVGGYLTSLTEDTRGRIWFGTRSGGFGYCENGRVCHFLSDAGERCSDAIGALLVDRWGVLWLGSLTSGARGGLCRYDGKSFITFTCSDGLIGGRIRALCEDRNARLWIGTSEGVSRYDGERFVTFTQSDGLPHDIIAAIAQTEDGKLWFGTQGGGVCCYDGKTFQTIQLPDDPGCNVIHAIHQDRAGRIWFGTGGGLVRYTPQRMPPEVTITGIVADRTYEATEEIELPTTVGRIGFRFRGRSPVDRASRLVYRYRLDGYDRDWQQTRETQIDYPQLPPGKYRFCVEAVDSDLNYSEMKEIRLAVIPDPRVAGLTEALRSTGTSGEFVGKSPALHKILFQIQEVARANLTVLIVGETGTGKGLVARAIHGMSVQRKGPFIPVNCGGIPEGLVESELFGHEKGAFTGAVSRKLGKVELAKGGTLFLDEIGDLALEAQAKLLRFLEERTFERVGGEETLEVDVRVIAATNRDLQRMVLEGRFREDLYYRLQAFPIRVPPLRERLEDIPLLVKYFADRFALHLNRPVPEVDPAVMKHLQRYTWPGNVRELEHQVQRAVLSCRENMIRVEDMLAGETLEERASASRTFVSLEEEEKWHQEQEKRHIEEALETTSWVIYGERGAARLLGMHPEKLRYRMKKYGLSRPR